MKRKKKKFATFLNNFCWKFLVFAQWYFFLAAECVCAFVDFFFFFNNNFSVSSFLKWISELLKTTTLQYLLQAEWQLMLMIACPLFFHQVSHMKRNKADPWKKKKNKKKRPSIQNYMENKENIKALRLQYRPCKIKPYTTDWEKWWREREICSW